MKEIIYKGEVYKSIFEDNCNSYINKDGKVITYNKGNIKERKAQINKSGSENLLIRYNGKYKTVMTKSTAHKLFGIDENIYSDYKDVVGYEGLYKVNNKGDILSLGNGKSFFGVKHLIPAKQENGHMVVTLHKNGNQITKKVHRIVAEAFIPNPNKYETINHINHNKEDNNVENLEWCTQRYNNVDEHGIKIYLIDTIGNNNLKYNCYKDCADDFNVCINTIKYALINNKLLNNRYKVVLQ